MYTTNGLARVAGLLVLVGAAQVSQAQGITVRCGGDAGQTSTTAHAGYHLNNNGDLVFTESSVVCGAVVGSPDVPNRLEVSFSVTAPVVNQAGTQATVTFNQSDRVGTDPTAILGSTYYKNIDTEYQHGWAAISFVNHPTLRPSVALPAIADPGGVVFDGLPVTGFFVTNANNGVIANGTLANYSALFRHRTERSITVAS